MDYFKRNNFDLIRLAAAFQVLVIHATGHLGVGDAPWRVVVGYFPGVPAFFFISGFLISASWERNPVFKTFALNRALRIFPALAAAVVFAVVTLLLFYDRSILLDNLLGFLTWIACQVTFLQDWNPDFLRGYGLGVVNGNLWTIPVELSFYLFTPLLYWVFRKSGRPNAALLLVIVCSFAVQYTSYLYQDDIPQLAGKLLRASPVPWVGMFCCGVLAQRWIDRIYPYVAGKLLLFIVVYVAVSALSHFLPAYPFLRGSSNTVGILNFPILCGLILAMAYTGRGLADRVLARNDISYGVYIFHAPLMNVLIQEGYHGWSAFLVVVVGTLVLSSLSWRFVERPALRLRKKALYQRS